MKKKGKFMHSSRQKDTIFKNKHKGESNEIICLKCKKPGHMKVECPQLKRKIHSGDKKKKSLMVTWDDSYSEKSRSSDDEQTNICLMVDTDDKVEVKKHALNLILLIALHEIMKRYAL